MSGKRHPSFAKCKMCGRLKTINAEGGCSACYGHRIVVNGRAYYDSTAVHWCEEMAVRKERAEAPKDCPSCAELKERITAVMATEKRLAEERKISPAQMLEPYGSTLDAGGGGE